MWIYPHWSPRWPAITRWTMCSQDLARIFCRNALDVGLPLFEADIGTQVEDAADVELDAETGMLRVGDRRFGRPPPPEFVRRIWVTQGIANYFRQNERSPGEV